MYAYHAQRGKSLSQRFWGAYSLRIHLIDVRQTFCENITRYLITIFVSELCRLSPCSAHGSSSVRYRPSHHATNGWGELEDMGDRRGVNQLVLILIRLTVYWCRLLAGRHTGTFFCDSTTAQVFPLTPTEVMFAAVIALKAYSNRLSRKLFYPAVSAGSMGPTPILLAMLRDLKGSYIRRTYQLDRVCLDPRI